MIQARSIYGLHLLLCSAFFYYLLRKWSFDMSENQPSKLLIVPVLEFLTAEMESALEPRA